MRSSRRSIKRSPDWIRATKAPPQSATIDSIALDFAGPCRATRAEVVARWGATADDLWVGLYAHGDADGATLGLLRARLTALRGKPIRDKVWRGKISIGSDRGYRDVDDMDGFSLGGRHVEPEAICTSAAGRCKENAFKDAVVLGLILTRPRYSPWPLILATPVSRFTSTKISPPAPSSDAASLGMRSRRLNVIRQ